MCIGIPMQVMELEDSGFVHVQGRGQNKRVNTALVGTVQVGDWVLVHINDAREVIDFTRAQEVNATLDLVEAVIQGKTGSRPEQTEESGHKAEEIAEFAAFALPSAMDPRLFEQWSGASKKRN